MILLLLFSCSGKKEKVDSGVTQTGTTPYFYRAGADSTAPADSQLQIVSYGPQGETRGQAQIKIDFSNPLIPLTTLSDAERKSILDHFILEPAVEGNFRFLGTTTVVFQPAHSLPLANTFKVTITSGVKDIHGNELGSDFSWEFQTPLPQIQIDPYDGRLQVNIDVAIEIRSNTALDLESLEEKCSLSETVSNRKMDYRLLEHEENAADQQDIGMGRIWFRYIFKPKQLLKKDTDYTLMISEGLMTKRGNRPLPHAITSRFKTFPPFQFLRTGFCDGCGGNLVTAPILVFTTRPQYKDIDQYISIEPATEQSPFYLYGCGDNDLGVNDYLLQPHTTYTVTMKPGLKDQFEQELENPQTATFTTGEATPKMWGPSGYQIITPNIEPTLGIKTININTAFYKLFSLQPDQILVREQLDYYNSIQQLLNAIKSVEQQIDVPLNESKVGKSLFDLRPLLRGGNYGVVAYTFRSPKVQCFEQPIQFNGLVLRTNLGIFTQFHPSTGIVKINQLTDGKPVSGTKLTIYREDDLPRLDKIWDRISGSQIAKIDPCFQGLTDSSGLLILSGQEMAKCTTRRTTNKVINELYPPEADPDDILYDQELYGSAEPPRLLIVAEKGDDWTFLQTSSYGNPTIWQLGMMADWEAERPISRGTIFSDHYLYRPGDTVRMKGIARYLLYGKLLNGKGREYTIKLRDPMGAEKEIGKVKVGDFGTFNIDISTRAGQTLGYYQVVAETPDPGLQFYGEFRLAEFRVPEFQVKLDLDKKIAVAGDPLQINWEGKYYFGAPMADASSSLNITRRKTYFEPKGWEEFSFGIPDYLEEQRVELSGSYLKETLPLDPKGLGEKSIRLRQDDVPYPMSYYFDVEVEDVSRQTISAGKEATLLPDERLIGVKLTDWIITKKNPVNVSLIVSSPEGKLMSDIPLNVKLIKKEYHSVKTETPDGRFTTERNIVKKTVETKEAKSSSQPVQISFTPLEAGSYIILAELKKKPDSGTAAATSLWVAGEEYVPWEETGEDRLEVIMDKKEYQIGDEATAFIQSPFPEAELFITVCREKIFQQDVIKMKGSSYTYHFKITDEMLPNAYVGAVLFRLGDPIVPVKEEVGKHLERIGFAAFQISRESRYLQLQVKPDRLKARPAEQISVDIEVKKVNQQGHPSELTVMVVDEAVLALSGYSPPDLVEVVYAYRGLSARVNDNRPFVITEADLLQKGSGYGGGILGGMGEPRVRKEFLKLAYYNPALLTDPNGKASFQFKLPDNLTTWRIMVVAVGQEDLFGYGEEKLLVSQPFILRAVLPRFARIGDQFFSGVAITNLTEGKGEVKVQTEIEGSSVSLQEASGVQEAISINPGESKTVLFPYQTSGTGESTLKFTAHFAGIYDGKPVSETDALQIPLAIKDLLATETVVAVGETSERELQKLKVDQSIRKDSGGLNLLLSSTALSNIGEGAKYLVDYPYGCLEQTASRLLALLQLKFLSDKYGFQLEAVKPVDQVIEANIKKILLLQNSDGGFKFWTSSPYSDCYLSPYAAYLFKRSQELGYSIPPEAVQYLIGYLNNTLINPCFPIPEWKMLAEYRINILIGLQALGRRDETYFEEYFNRRNDLSLGAQIQLAYLMSQAPSWRNEAVKMLQEIKNAVFITAQTAHLESPRNLPPSWLFMYSPIITTAEAVKLFLELEPDSEYIAKFARYLLDARKNGRWRYTYENAKAIDGLVEISLRREAEPPDYTVDVLIAGNSVLKEMFKGYQYQPREKSIPMANLPEGLNDIEITKSGSGILYYTLSYSYRLQGPQVSRQQGFSIKRTVKDRIASKLLQTYQDLPPQPLTVKAGDVLEIELEFLVPQSSYHLVIDDAIPAGLEAIDASLKTTSARYEYTEGYDDTYEYSGNPINHTELRDDRVALFSDNVMPGIYNYRYLLRATTSGTFLWPAAKISLMYEPEQFGICAEGWLKVEK